MAAVKEQSMEYGGAATDEDDIRGDGKKRKFKPLSAVRKFFGKKKKKDDSVVAVKAHSTTALHYRDVEEEDDDGGFKVHHPKPLSLTGHRSISEDSVFSPETKDNTPISSFPKSAVSEESLPKSAFQSELLSKLNKRRSQYSDDDHDDGLPKSPVPPVTTADVIMGGPLKPGPSGYKSNNRDSDQSLISVDSSDNEDDLFHSKWKSAVPTKKSGSQTTSKTSKNEMENLDFSMIQKTELLTSSAARDKISVKPKGRKATRQSRKTRDTSSPQSLPSLNEESPTRSQPEESKPSLKLGGPRSPTKPAFAKSEDVLAPTSLSVGHPPLSPVDKKTGQNASAGARTSFISSSTKGDKGSDIKSSPTSPLPAKPVVTSASFPPKPTSSLSPTSKLPPQKSGGVPAASSQSSSSVRFALDGEEKKLNVEQTVEDKKQEKTLPTSSADAVVMRRGSTQLASNEDKPKVDIKSRMSHFQAPESSANKVSMGSSSETSTGKTANSETTSSPKYQHQNRSRTLPGVTDERTSPKVQRSSSHRVPATTTSISPEPAERPTSQIVEKSIVTSTTGTTTTTATSAMSSGVKKLDSKAETSSTTSEPAWLNMVRKKKEEHVSAMDSDSVKTSTSHSDKPSSESHQSASGGSAATPKSVFSSASYLEKKRGSVETISLRNRDQSDQASKRTEVINSAAKRQSIDLSPTKRPSIDISSTKRESIDIGSSKRPSIDISSTKRESIEINVSELSSVKALRNSFAPSKTETSSKTSSMKDSKPNVPSNDAKSTSEPASDTTKRGSISGGISNFRGSSMKTSPVKTADMKTAMHGRSESVKGPSAIPSAASTPSVFTKADSKFDSTRLSPSPPSSTSDSAQSNPSLPSNTTVVTSLSTASVSNSAYSSVRPYSVYSSKFSNMTSASRPVSSVIPPSSKSSLTTPNPVASAGVKPSSDIGVKSLPPSGVKSVALASTVASNASAPSSTTIATSSSSSSSSSTAVSSSTSASAASSSPSRSSSVRSHSSFTASSAFRPQISSSSPPLASRSSLITKSPSFKSSPPTEKASTPEKKVTEKTGHVTEKTTSTAAVERRAEPKVPAWRANIQKDVKIEIIENSSSSSSPSSSSKSEILRKGSDKLSDTGKKQEQSGGGVQVDKSSNRSSKVLDLVKNFQNFQVST